jgi:single-strand DNA-binding protein
MSINKCIFIGNVGNDPEIITTNDGKIIAKFSIALSESWTDKTSGEKKTSTEWVNIDAFGNIANIVKQYVKKGGKVYVEGKIKTDKFPKDGVDHFRTKIVLQDFNSRLELLGSKNESDKPVDAHNAAKADGFQPQDEDFAADDF